MSEDKPPKVKFTTRYGTFETDHIEIVEKDFPWLPVKGMREQAQTEDGRTGFYDMPTQTLFIFETKRVKP